MLDQPLPQLLQSLGHTTLSFVTTWGLAFVLTVVWVAWWLWGVNWKNVWPALAQGAWMPAVLVVIVSALVWSQITPVDCTCLGFMTIPNFWWQLGEVSMLASLALFCGWLQGYFHWTPDPVEFEPAGHGGHDHGHGGHPEEPHDEAHGAPHTHDHGTHDHGHHH